MSIRFCVEQTPANVIVAKVTKTIPIVFTTSSDPVQLGLVASLNQPGGNATGAVTLNVEVASKRLELLHEMVPTASTIFVLANPTNPNAETQSKTLQAAAHTLGQQIVLVSAATEGAIDAMFARFVEQGAGALLVNTDAFLFSQRNRLADLAKRYNHFRSTEVRRGRRADELWRRCCGYIPLGRHLHRRREGR